MKCTSRGHETEIELEKRREFNEDTRIKCLLWSDRHCCLCGKRCKTDIEIHHIGSVTDNSLDNALPLCYNCHAEIHRYNDKKAMGSKYKPKELVERREQIYERYTRQLVSPVLCEITQLIRDNPRIQLRRLPSVGFNIQHAGNTFPMRATIRLSVFLGEKNLGLIESGYYNGKIKWHLNPLKKVYGNFSIMEKCVASEEKLTIEIVISVIDIYDRKHSLLPFCYSFDRKENSWFLEPTEFKELATK